VLTVEVAEPFELLVGKLLEVRTGPDGSATGGILHEVVLLDAVLQEELELADVALELSVPIDPRPARRGVGPAVVEPEIEHQGPPDVGRRRRVGEQNALGLPIDGNLVRSEVEGETITIVSEPTRRPTAIRRGRRTAAAPLYRSPW
jgi:hypothetical protein